MQLTSTFGFKMLIKYFEDQVFDCQATTFVFLT